MKLFIWECPLYGGYFYCVFYMECHWERFHYIVLYMYCMCAELTSLSMVQSELISLILEGQQNETNIWTIECTFLIAGNTCTCLHMYEKLLPVSIIYMYTCTCTCITLLPNPTVSTASLQCIYYNKKDSMYYMSTCTVRVK